MPVIVFIVCCVFLLLFAVKGLFKELSLKKYTEVYADMPESQMLQIMGGGYSMSTLKNGRKKYEWRINGQRVKKVDIYTKDGFVEEIKPFNI